MSKATCEHAVGIGELCFFSSHNRFKKSDASATNPNNLITPRLAADLELTCSSMHTPVPGKKLLVWRISADKFLSTHFHLQYEMVHCRSVRSSPRLGFPSCPEVSLNIYIPLEL